MAPGGRNMGGNSGSRADASSPQAVSTKGFDPGRIAAELTVKERAALAWFSEGGFVCGFRPEWAGLSQRSYDRLDKLGLFESHWTWASTTRPDTGLSKRGLAVRAAIAMEARQGGDVKQAPSASADDSAAPKGIAQ